jgi:hypothetical protein
MQPETAFRTVAQESAEKTVGVFQVGELVYLAHMRTTQSFDKQVSETARLQAARLNPNGCLACRKRAVAYVPLVGSDGPVFLCHIKPSCDDAPTVAVRALAVEASKESQHSVTPFVVTSSSFAPLFEGGFSHWTVKPAAVTDARKAKLFDRACRDYVDMENERMLTALIAALLSSKEMVTSINVFDNCLKQTPRGAVYRATTDWILGIQKYAADTFAGRFWTSLSSLEKLHAVMYALGTSDLTKGANGASSIPNFHQANNSILGFLKNAHNEKGMISLINDQSSPDNYQRRTALSEGQLSVGQSLLGNFTNSVSRVSTLQTLYGDQFLGWSQRSDCDKASSAAGFNALHEMFATKKASAALPTKAQLASEFAARCALKAPVISSISQLMAVLTDGKPHTLTVDASYHAPWVLVDTTLSTEMLRPCQKHLWGVFNRSEARVWGASSNTRVLGVFRMPMGELLFLLEGLNLPANLGNFNFPEFLAAHMHAAKAAFEALNKITSAVVPPLANGDFYAAGICASPQTSRRVLSKNIDIVLDGVKHTLTSFD